MLTMVEVLNERGESLKLSLLDPTNGYLLHAMDGLDPGKASVSSSPFATLDGAQYQSSRREPRNPRMKLGLEPDYGTQTVQDLRMNLYRYMMPKSKVTMVYYIDDVAYAKVDAVVESLETPLFSKTPEALISFLCFDPDFYAVQSSVVSGTTTPTTLEKTINYGGSTPTGISLRLVINRALPEFMLYNRVAGDQIQSLEFSTPLAAGDILVISTIAREKAATLERGGSRKSMLYGISPSSTWIQLQPGVNNLRVQAAGAAIPYTVAFTEKYGGL